MGFGRPRVVEMSDVIRAAWARLMQRRDELTSRRRRLNSRLRPFDGTASTAMLREGAARALAEELRGASPGERRRKAPRAIARFSGGVIDPGTRGPSLHRRVHLLFVLLRAAKVRSWGPGKT